jgi:hypothetical protein
MADKVYVGDIGTLIRIHCGEDVSAGGSASIRVKKPNGSKVTWSATLSTYYMNYTAVSGDLNLPGIYYCQPYVNLGAWTGRGKTVSFRVYDHFE